MARGPEGPKASRPLDELDNLIAGLNKPATPEAEQSSKKKTSAINSPQHESRARNTREPMDKPSMGPEGESKTERLKRLLELPTLQGKPAQVELTEDKFFNYRDSDFPFRTPEGGRISYAEARNLLIESLREKGFSKAAIFHAVGVNVTPLVRRNARLGAEINAPANQKPKGYNEEKWQKARTLTQRSLQLSLRSIFTNPELYEIKPESEVPVEFTHRDVEQRILYNVNSDGEPTLWIDPLMNNGEHLHHSKLREIANWWLRWKTNPLPEADPAALGYIKQTYLNPLMTMYIQAGNFDRSGRDPEVARHNRLREAERLIAIFLHDIAQTDGLSRYLEAIEKVDTSELPAALRPYFLRVERRTPAHMQHSDREARREWCRKFVENMSPEELEAIETELIFEGNTDILWQDELGNRELFVVKFIIESLAKKKLTGALERSETEATEMIRQFVRSEINPAFHQIYEAVTGINDIRKGKRDRGDRARLMAEAESGYQVLSEKMYEPIASPRKYWRKFVPSTEGTDFDDAFLDIDVNLDNYEEFLSFISPESPDRGKWVQAMNQFVEAHQLLIQERTKHFMETTDGRSGNSIAMFEGSVEFQNWKRQLESLSKFFKAKEGDIGDEERAELTASLQEFLDMEETLEIFVAENFALEGEAVETNTER